MGKSSVKDDERLGFAYCRVEIVLHERITV
jgi:hypothetical protein